MDDSDPLASAARASLWTGPIFSLTFMVVTMMETLPHSIDYPTPIGLLILSLLVSVLIGSIVAIVPALLATSLLGLVARHFPLMQLLPVWLAVAAALVLVPAYALHSPIPILAALTVTALATAARCHAGWRWKT